jgi:hypothetical protein
MGISHGDDPAIAPVLPLGAGEGTDVGSRHPVPELEVVETNLVLAPPCPNQGIDVAEPAELFRLKCASHRYTADTNSTHFKRNNPLVCRVSARYNHGSIGSEQVYLARRRVYNHRTAHQLLIYRSLNIITNHFKLK